MKELEAIQKLTDSFSLFPSVGFKSAERMAYALLDMPQDEVKLLLKNIEEVKTKIHPCAVCGLLTEDEKCSICSSEDRDHSTCIVLASPKDVLSFEKLGTYNGVYHILGGLISPSKNIGPENLKIDELIARIDKEHIEELIIATNGTPEGEITALYLARILSNKNIKITRIGYGMPIGASFEYIDPLTIEKALKSRTNINSKKEKY